MSRFLLLILSIVGLALFASALHIECDVGKSDVYTFDSVVTAFGGPDGENAEKKEQFTISATVALTCLKKFLVKGEKIEYNHLNVFNIRNAQIRFQPQEQISEEAAQKYEPMIHDLEDQLVDGSTYFVQSNNGKISKVVYSKDEDPMITNVKKSIIQEFQTKVRGSGRVEQSTEGVIKGHYNQAVGDDGTVFLQKISNSEDVLEDAFGDAENNGHLSERNFQQESIVALTPDGRVKEAVSEKLVEFGKGDERKHEAYENLRGKIQSKDSEVPEIDSFFSGKTKSVLTFQTQIDISEEFKDVEITEEEFEEILNTESLTSDDEEDDYTPADFTKTKLNIKPTLKESTLVADEDLFHTLRSLYKQQLESTVDLKDLLTKLHARQRELYKQLRDNGEEDNGQEYSEENVHVVADAQHFCKYVPEKCLEISQEYFSELDVSDSDNESISHVLQSIMVSTQSRLGQEALLKTFTNPHLIRHGILRTLDLKKPIPEIVGKLRSLAQGEGLPENIDEYERSLIVDNAYMAWADAASRMNPDQGIEIVENIINKMQVSDDDDELLLHVHALGNAGESVPVDGLQHLISSKSTSDQVKEAAIQALRKFSSPQNNRKVTRLLHNVISDPRQHALLKKKAISTLTTRLNNRSGKKYRRTEEDDDEAQISRGTIMFLERYLHDSQYDPSIRKSILEYYLEEGSEDSLRIIDNFFTGGPSRVYDDDDVRSVDLDLQLDDDLLLRAVRRVIRNVGRAIRRVGRAVGNAIKGLKAVAEIPKKISQMAKSFGNLFKGATFKGNKICKVVGLDGNKLCVYDSDMAAFIHRQGDLSKMKFNKGFAYEKLIGAEALHAYVGGVGYAGATINCKKNQLAVSVFGRVGAYTRILNRRTDLLTGEVTLNKPVNGDIVDRVYLKVFNTVLVNKPLIPANLRKYATCGSSRVSLINKNYPNLVGFEIVIPIIIPISIRISVAAKFGVDFAYEICPTKLQASAGVEPYFAIGVSGGVGISILVAKAHLTLTATIDYRLKPNIGIENCQLCAKLDYEMHPLVIDIGVAASFLTFKWNTKFVTIKTSPQKGTYTKVCLSIKALSDDDFSLQTPNVYMLQDTLGLDDDELDIMEYLSN